ncbi:hypothetical protein A6P39_041080 [Streptomyces sp. FXJ1.172]|uniref:hypothetical protein n=1 Tax=Streptomyces sp. FXJ1.172 TaxID=710705 RepID=UPI0007CFEA2C|nr:hypothetical protein [Streptomyces sp. FXJ1.172]WEO99914.1 hypothetical protein A6P39_041080 [Streptomyces sp. FXJ1.172]
MTDNGACYRSGDFARIVGNRTRHQKTKHYNSHRPDRTAEEGGQPPARRLRSGVINVQLSYTQVA